MTSDSKMISVKRSEEVIVISGGPRKESRENQIKFAVAEFFVHGRSNWAAMCLYVTLATVSENLY